MVQEPLQRYRELSLEGHEALDRGDPVAAIARFVDAQKHAVRHNLPRPLHAAAEGWTELSRGVRLMQGPDPDTAALHFDRAIPLLDAADHAEGLLRARAFAALARAWSTVQTAPLPDLLARFRAAVAALRAAQDHHPGDPAWSLLVLATTTELRAWEATAALVDGDAVAAAMIVNQLRTAIDHSLDAAPDPDPRRPAWRRLGPTLLALRFLADERAAFRALALPRAEAHARAALAELAQGGDPALLPLAQLALDTVLALRAILDGQLAVAARHLQSADRLAATRPPLDPRAARVVAATLPERRALLDNLRLLVAGREHPLFATQVQGPLSDRLRADIGELERAWAGGAWGLCVLGAESALQRVLQHVLRADTGPALADLLDDAARAGLIEPVQAVATDTPADRERASAALETLRAVLAAFSYLAPQ